MRRTWNGISGQNPARLWKPEEGRPWDSEEAELDSVVSAVFALGVAAEMALILLLIRARAFGGFPAFFVFLCWSLLSDCLLYYVRVRSPETVFFRVYVVQLVVDSAMIFAVLVEVAWNVLLPIRSSLPKHAWVGIAAMIALGGLALWPVAGLAAPAHILSAAGMNFIRLQQTPAILRVVFFLALAGCSQVLSIGWRDRELQIATGLGFYSIVSLAITVLHTHQSISSQSYHWVDEMGGICYLATLSYWIYSFATRPAERREFTPQMESLLLAVAGVARTTRIALTDSSFDKHKRGRDR